MSAIQLLKSHHIVRIRVNVPSVSLQLSPKIIKVQSSRIKVVAVAKRGLPGHDGAEVTSLPWNAITNKPNSFFIHDFSSLDNGNIAINHGMQKHPAFRVIDSAGSEWFGFAVNYIDLNNAVLGLTYAFGGQVFCS